MAPLLILAVTFLLMWVLFIFPQQRRLKAHRALVARLEVGDEVMATSGLFGTIADLDDEVVHLEVADGVVLRLARGAIATRVGEEPVVEEAPAEEAVEVPSATAADRALDEPAPEPEAAAEATPEAEAEETPAPARPARRRRLRGGVAAPEDS